jgi:glycosyltransferase involved in cell wall biosynthesis
MTEPLGHAQVLPYLVGLARRGVEIEMLSFEPAGTRREAIDAVASRLQSEGVRWQPMVRSPSHAFARKVWEISAAVVRGLVAALQRRPDIVHARSYLPAAAADVIARLAPKAKLLFDVRGMLADEAADGGAWARDGARFRVVKRYERYLLNHSAGVVVLTEALRRVFRRDGLLPAATPLEVVPCCVDETSFRVAPETRGRVRAELGLEGRTVVVYSGTLGSWYKAREMARFVSLLRRRRPDVAFLVLTQANASDLVAAARSEGFGERDVVVRKVTPGEMPSVLSAGDLGLSFIQPCFSKLGSSPTKVAEYLAAGLSVVANDQVGDQGDLASDADACVVVPSLDEASLEAGAARAAELMRRPEAERAAAARAVASRRFSLTGLGVPRYLSLYGTLFAGSGARP